MTTHRPTLADLIREPAARRNGGAPRARPRVPDAAGGDPEPAPRPRLVEPYQPFPVEALPPPLGDFVQQGAAALGCDTAYVALPVLAVAAGCIGATRVIRLKRGWDEPSVVWAAIVAESGTLKTPAGKLALGHLRRRQYRLLAEHRAQDEGAPPLRRVIVSDTTVERLAEILEDNPRGVLLARDELAGWLGSFTRYKGRSGSSDLPSWLEMHQAGAVLKDRVTGDRRTIGSDRAAVSIVGTIQPGTLARAMTPEFFEAGLCARLLLAQPPRLPKRWSEVEVDPDTEAAYCSVLDRLLSLDFGAGADGESVPSALALSPEAKAAWVEFYDGWAREQAAVEGELAAAYAKLEASAARFALLYHTVGCAARGLRDVMPVEAESVEAGVTLCRWFAREARRIYSMLHESEGERDTRRLLEFVRSRGGRISPRELRQSSRRYRDTEAAAAALDGLVASGLARWEDRTRAGAGRPTRDCVLLSTVYVAPEFPPDPDEGAPP